ncbi:MAG: 16S rRNA (guanine(527)-N(7))-methyltransferase RsmG [Desulfobacteraceae bacterium]|jgi:16S rRNA (guanine527-N7)-methyltransferase|nr:16S rRNA (guanine(527)-N(7))-methyltransferase RsmG [Desulfobacteraceae bacterium]
MKTGSKEWSQLILDGAKAFDLNIDRRHTELFAAHARELLHWNKTTNLTTITDPFEVAVKHFVDSLAPARLISPGATLLDIGSGGGFPGIPLKVVIPSLKVTLVDASRKRVNFLKHVIRTLKLEGIEALHIRAEDLAGDPAYRQRFDFVTCRALTDLRSFIHQARALLTVNGQMIALKGLVGQAELDAVHSSVLAVETYMLPFTQSKRSIFKIQ